jgi:hypothetical protein
MPNQREDPIQPSRLSYSIDDTIQQLRILKLSQIRRQLEIDHKINLNRYNTICQFIANAREHQ